LGTNHKFIFLANPKPMKIIPGLLQCAIFVIFGLQTFGQTTTDCSRFKVGSFKTTIKGIEALIIRNEKIQTEIIKTRNIKVTFYISWHGNCSYDLRPTPETLKIHPGMSQNAIVHVAILKVKPGSYIQQSTSNFSTAVITSEMFKL
jgi:hypothetical protein